VLKRIFGPKRDEVTGEWRRLHNNNNSGYSLLGGLRALAQTISYEVRLAFILLSFVVLISGCDLLGFYFFQSYVWLIFLSFPLSFG
jgi:NADH-ubiquinone oxidoreductase chain 1